MEREWRDALLITEPSACSWTTSNSTGSWAEESEERQRDGGWDPVTARGRRKEEERLQWVGGGKGARGAEGKNEALMIYEMVER